jgi:hypothetical protein
MWLYPCSVQMIAVSSLLDHSYHIYCVLLGYIPIFKANESALEGRPSQGLQLGSQTDARMFISMAAVR